MGKMLMTYSHNHERICGEYLDIYRNSLIFDKDRKSIYTQGEEFGYISSIHTCEKDNVNTPTELYNPTFAYHNQQIISNIHFDRINGLSYTYSNLTTDVYTQSVNLNNNIVSVSIVNGIIQLEAYKPTEIVGINVAYNGNVVNDKPYINNIYPLPANTQVDYDTIVVYTKSIKECATYESVVINTDYLLGSSIIDYTYLCYIDDKACKFNRNNSEYSITYFEDVTYVSTISEYGYIPGQIAGTQLNVEVAVQDVHQRLSNPPSLTREKITFGWYDTIYYSSKVFSKYTPELFVSAEHENMNYQEYSNKYDAEWLLQAKHIFIQHNSVYIFLYNKDEYPKLDILPNEGYMYVYIPYELAKTQYLRFTWNGGIYETTPYYATHAENSTSILLGETFIINGIKYTVYAFNVADYNKTVDSSITLNKYN